ncbi:uncharacterized protein LAJ45_00255 [Morchella importuna]|uniref:uncharacterized protein n=1 Tax=Morchella importuna TaxID=1174673 RepID=UPI001E8E3C5B|nr:uncharacterized protein LAJ45_00255 [Morchella importuna]KAH8155246.1 hypothetical protein LAJ45_00255 [Morchella importuna]
MSDMSRLDPRRLSSPARRAIAGLAVEIPLEHRGVMAIRFLLFIALFIFGFTYASAQPRVYHDILIWKHNATPPHTVYIYRNTTSWADSRGSSSGIADGGDDDDTTLFGSFLWNKTRSPGSGARICNDTRFANAEYGIACDGTSWSQANRIGFEDSLGFRREGEKKALAFLSLGILPLAWLPSGRLAGKEGPPEKWSYNITDQLLSNRPDLKTGTVMGWLCFIAFGALIALNMILIDDLNMFAKIIERTQSQTQGRTLHDDIVERVSEFGAVGNTGNYYLQRPAAATPRRRASGGNCV